MEQVRKIFTKNIYFLIAYSVISVTGVWVYEKIIRPRTVQRDIQNAINEIRAMREERSEHFASLFTGAKDSIRKI